MVDRAVHHNSSLLPILFFILASFVEWPLVAIQLFVELILWTCWASEPSASTPSVPFLTLQVWPDWPVDLARFYKEVATSSSFQFVNLGEKNGLKYIQRWPSNPNPSAKPIYVRQHLYSAMIITGLPMLVNPVLMYFPSHCPWASTEAHN